MDNKAKVMDTKEMKFTPNKVSIEKPIKDLFDECLSFISMASFEI